MFAIVFSVVNGYRDHLKLCVFMVEGMSVVVNVMLSLMSQSPVLCNLSVRTVVCSYVFWVCLL